MRNLFLGFYKHFTQNYLLFVLSWLAAIVASGTITEKKIRQPEIIQILSFFLKSDLISLKKAMAEYFGYQRTGFNPTLMIRFF